MAESDNDKVALAANLTAAWLSNPNVRPIGDDAVTFLQSMHSTLRQLSGADGAVHMPQHETPSTGQAEHAPAVTVRKSLASRDKIISLIDGKPYSSLKRHLSSHGLDPTQYRERYGLKADYPMVAPAYAEKRRELAKKIGLGRKPGETMKSAVAKKPGAPAKRGRPPKGVGAMPATARKRGRPPKAAAATPAS
jgi:predicted transcriptional regulator